jgi:hypothetical protein
MKTKAVMVGAIGSLLCASAALAAPPFAETNREGSMALSALVWKTLNVGEYWYLVVGVRDYYNMQGEYQWSYASVTEWSYSYVTGQGYSRLAECRIDRGALKINANGTVGSANVYVADARNQEACSYAANGIEPFEEILVDLAGNDPTWLSNSQSIGRNVNGQVTSHFVCDQSQASGFQNATLAMNGESLPVTNMDTYVYDCHSVLKR